MELFPNIRFNTALVFGLLAVLIGLFLLLQPSDLTAKLMFGGYVAIVFGIVFWRDAKAHPRTRR
ncbi:MAG: hypothetical protein M9938_10715 [Solirubrobacterales bacterium]|nr:hypothetical protein [Solirubrobacterales bacterium]